MNAMIALTFFLLSACSSVSLASQRSPLLPEQFSPSSSDESTEQEFVVATASASRMPCIALATHDKNIIALISRDLIEELAESASKNDYHDEAGRLSFIHGGRAKELLDAVSTEHDVNGCAQARIAPQTQYLLARLLNSGQAAIVDARTNSIAPSIIVKVSSMLGPAGFIAYRLQESPATFRTFLSYQTWVR
jgi:hypothetical protein